MVKRLTKSASGGAPSVNPLRERPLPLGTLFAAAAHRLAGRMDDGLAAAGFTDLRTAHAPVFMAIDPDGTRASTLAQRAHTTKQAMGEQIRYLSDRGYLQVVPDPADGRARLVQLTAAGWRAVRAAVDVIDEFDGWLESVAGRRQVTTTRATLARVLEQDEKS